MKIENGILYIDTSSIRVEHIKEKSFEEFEKQYKGTFKPDVLKQVFKKCGGKIVTKNTKKEDSEDK
jgi:hypothetical protein